VGRDVSTIALTQEAVIATIYLHRALHAIVYVFVMAHS
jgi:hypothetical protein